MDRDHLQEEMDNEQIKGPSGHTVWRRWQIKLDS